MSPAATLTLEDAAAAILRSADKLFYTNGIAAVTMADIRDHAGVSMRRLYSMYPSKADLITGWLTQRHLDWTASLKTDVSRRMASGASAINALFASLETWMVTTNFRGCGFINTHAERSDFTDEHQAIIRTHKQQLDAFLQELVPDQVGLVVLVDGAIVQASIFADPSPIRSAHQAALTIQELRTP